ncbi:hypothetical protein JQ615_09620 [Bradyrhizobium jicamae]|uniref:Transcriptional coactivator p15 (PC4) C-terminal domain-containing protein n=1 Tax=Bradyrhizobium jicamae TaxID=280332 RepID=A0ABS5FFU1_9BRAD|nr:PC4/YdbC family ssDNA-binding protein [Bradyrhizobium jicamae]MBR0795645.1 hypothetical protein [Bradyrhizobium jicamae]
MKRKLKDKFAGFKGQIVDSWTRKSGDRVLLSTQRYRGKKGADLRIWFRTENGFRPSNRGIRIPFDELESLFASVKRLKKLADDDEL